MWRPKKAPSMNTSPWAKCKQPQDAENEGVSNRHHGVGRTQHQAVYDLLLKHLNIPPKGAPW